MEQQFPQLRCCIPKTFEPSSLPRYNKRHHWKYEFFIHSMILASLRGKKKFTQGVSLDSQLLKKLYGDRYYSMILSSLIEGGVLKKQNYRPGIHSYKYSIAPGVMSQGIKRISIDKYSIRRKVGIYRNEHLSMFLKDENNRHEFSRLTHHTIDVDAAVDYINQTYKPGSIESTSRLIGVYEVDKLKDTSFSEDLCGLDWTFKVDRSGRWHTPISLLAKDIRSQFVRDENGHKLIEIDQACSHMAYSFKFHLEFNANAYTKESDDGEMLIAAPQIYGTPDRENNSEYLTAIDNAWRDNVFNGKIYHVLMDAMQFEGTKDEFKVMLFKDVFYNKYNGNRLTRMEKAFKQYFPNEFKRLRYAKKRLGNSEYCVQVTRYESKFWHRCVQRMMRKKFPLLTYSIVHDSMLVNEANAEEIKQQLTYLITDYFGGLTPLLRIKR